MTGNITINARKFDGQISRSWQCELVKETEKFFTFYGVFDFEINHKQLGIIRRNTKSYEYYWKDEYYNIFLFYEPEGEFRNFYCNLNLPPEFKDTELDYVDLDIDILVWKDFSVEILDMDEYEANTKKYNYPNELQHKVFQTLNELLEKIDKREFPFDISS